MTQLTSKYGFVVLGFLLVKGIFMYINAPIEYSYSFCMECFIIYLLAAIILLFNNVGKYKTIILFEFLFAISFFFVNYAYPIIVFLDDPYISLFSMPFNENVISKSTALATVGFCAYSLGQFENHTINLNLKGRCSKAYLSKVSFSEVLLLAFLFGVFFVQVYSNIKSGHTNSEGAGFFRIFAIYFIFKRLYNHELKHSHLIDISLWGIIALYIITNLLVGNRGDPLYLIMAFVIGYNMFVKRIPMLFFIGSVVVGLVVFFIIGQARVGEGEMSSGSMIDNIAEGNYYLIQDGRGLIYAAKDLIINNRTLYVLVDYKQNNGLNFGSTWQMGIYSVIPYLQSTMMRLFDIPLEQFASVELTTYLYFGHNSPDSFGLGTNLIGDIFISFGFIGVIFFMWLLGFLIKKCYRLMLKEDAVGSLFYICFFVFSVYYCRAMYLEPVRLMAWSYIMYRINYKGKISTI